MKKLSIALSVVGLFALVAPSSAWGQVADNPYHQRSFLYDFGVHQGKKSVAPKTISQETVQPETRRDPFNTENVNPYLNDQYDLSDYGWDIRTITTEKAPWIQLQFAGVNLGENSFLVITSHFDGDVQYFDHEMLTEQWSNHSAFFKGFGVDVELFVAPNDGDVTLKVVGAIVGEFQGGDPSVLRSICGPADNRVNSGFPFVDGRMMPLGCTGWLNSNGFFITAGHCLDGSSSSFTIFEFNVPTSLCDGTTQPAAVVNQYPSIFSSWSWWLQTIGEDWGMFNCGNNSNTGLSVNDGRRDAAAPFDGNYYHVTATPPAVTTIRIRGMGQDSDPVGCSIPTWNAMNQTLQYHDGPSLGETIDDADDAYWRYQTDTRGGNSGSAVASLNPGLTAIGIHTNAGCGDPVGTSGNHGTSFEANNLENAMNSFFEPAGEVEYVAANNPGSLGSGTAVRPLLSVEVAANQANAGHGPSLERLRIAGSGFYAADGVYAETFHHAGTTHGVILRRTVGAVKIGPGATAAPQLIAPDEEPNNPVVFNGQNSMSGASPDTDDQASKMETAQAGFTTYPNPFEDYVNLELDMPEGASVSLRLYDNLGKAVASVIEEDRAAGTYKERVNLGALAPGTYVLIGYIGDTRVSQELIKIR